MARTIRVIDPAKVIQLIGDDTTVIIANNVSEGFIPRPSSSSSEGIETIENAVDASEDWINNTDEGEEIQNTNE